jgi:hypothetical protein
MGVFLIWSDCAAQGGRMQVWNALTGTLSRVFRNLCWSEMTALCFDHAQRKMIIGENSGRIRSAGSAGCASLSQTFTTQRVQLHDRSLHEAPHSAQGAQTFRLSAAHQTRSSGRARWFTWGTAPSHRQSYRRAATVRSCCTTRVRWSAQPSTAGCPPADSRPPTGGAARDSVLRNSIGAAGRGGGDHRLRVFLQAWHCRCGVCRHVRTTGRGEAEAKWRVLRCIYVWDIEKGTMDGVCRGHQVRSSATLCVAGVHEASIRTQSLPLSFSRTSDSWLPRTRRDRHATLPAVGALVMGLVPA